MSVRPATTADVPEIVRIHKQRFSERFLSRCSAALAGSYYAPYLNLGVVLVHEGKLGVDGFVIGAHWAACQECKRRFIRASLWRAAWETVRQPDLAWEAFCRRFWRICLPFRPNPYRAEFRLLSIAIDERVAGTGVAAALVAAFEERIGDRWPLYGLSVRKDNPRAIRFYQKLGFEVEHTGQEHMHYWKQVVSCSPSAPQMCDLKRAG